MDVDEFDQQIEALRSRVAALLQPSDLAPISQQKLLQAVFEELHIALEQLKIAEEELQQQNKELYQQNEELLAARAEIEKERQRYQELFELAPDGYLVTDTEGKIQKANRAAATLLNISHKFLVGKPLIVFVAKSEYSAFYTFLSQLQSLNGVGERELRLSPRNHVFVDTALRVNTVHNQEGKLVALHWRLSDITKRKQVELALERLRRQNELILNCAGEGIYGLDLQGNATFVNPAATRMVGWKSDELIGKFKHAFIHHSKSDGTPYPYEECQICAAFKDGLVHSVNDEVFWRKDGTSFPVEYTSTPIEERGELVGAVVIFKDITERKQAEAKLREHAFYDVLTSLPNRALFMDRLEQALKQAKRHEENLFAVLFLDLDRFKVINDSLGHTFGDQLLIAFAGRLVACLRPTDTVARLGGDEFTILIEGMKDISDAVKVADRIQAELRLPFVLGEQEVFTTASIGIALSAIGYDRAADILRDADIAMYRAKKLGKACYEIFNTDMHIRAVARLQLENELRRGIERQEFQIYYQPIVSLKLGRIIGFEALVRWQHPNRGLLPPEDFLSVVEETGLSVALDQWVLYQACHQMHTWQRAFPINPPLMICVNFCSQMVAQSNLIEQIDFVLQETGLDAQSLRLEITESVIMENDQSARDMLLQLKALGIQLAIDDFGTGYSSLGRLHNFPISVLKIDRSFISQHTGTDVGNLQIVGTIVTLAHGLGMEVTAEGVEAKEQITQLRELNCEYGQGYFFSKPLNSEETEALIVMSPQW